MFALLGIFCFATFGFVWFYDAPLSTDYPLYVAVAKAFIDLAKDPPRDDYPYQMNLRVSSYETAQFILAFFIGLFGVTAGAKLSLSLYLLLFPLSVYFLVG